MQPIYDGNFSPGEVGHNASYMRVVEAYKLKSQIDQEAFNALAHLQHGLQHSETDQLARRPESHPGARLLQRIRLVGTWRDPGGEAHLRDHLRRGLHHRHPATTSPRTASSTSSSRVFGVKLARASGIGYGHTDKWTTKYSYTTTGRQSFDITASFDGIETDTQMRYASNNDAHFVMKQQLDVQSEQPERAQPGDRLRRAGLQHRPLRDIRRGAAAVRTTSTPPDYTQPQPSYTTGNADGLTGTLEPYDRPGKTNLFRTLRFLPAADAAERRRLLEHRGRPDLAGNSPDADAAAMRSAQGSASMPWRLLYRVTVLASGSCRRSRPASAATPQITPLMAVPVLNPRPTSSSSSSASGSSRPANNPPNDIEANVVLAAPTASGAERRHRPRPPARTQGCPSRRTT